MRKQDVIMDGPLQDKCALNQVNNFFLELAACG